LKKRAGHRKENEGSKRYTAGTNNKGRTKKRGSLEKEGNETSQPERKRIDAQKERKREISKGPGPGGSSARNGPHR